MADKINAVQDNLERNPFITIPETLVGVRKDKQIATQNGSTGGEIWTQTTFRLVALHSCFDTGEHIVWNVQGYPQPIHQRRTPRNLEAFRAFVSLMPTIESIVDARMNTCRDATDQTITPDPVAISGKIIGP